jgi:hypothetical protein
LISNLRINSGTGGRLGQSRYCQTFRDERALFIEKKFAAETDNFVKSLRGICCVNLPVTENAINQKSYLFFQKPIR